MRGACAERHVSEGKRPRKITRARPLVPWLTINIAGDVGSKKASSLMLCLMRVSRSWALRVCGRQVVVDTLLQFEGNHKPSNPVRIPSTFWCTKRMPQVGSTNLEDWGTRVYPDFVATGSGDQKAIMAAICAVKKASFDGVDCVGGDDTATGTVRALSVVPSPFAQMSLHVNVLSACPF